MNTRRITDYSYPFTHPFGVIPGSTHIKKTISYPPHNLIDTNGKLIYEFAVAGFSIAEISASFTNGSLNISGTRLTKDDEQPNYLHKGISTKEFTIKIDNLTNYELLEAELDNGILRISLEKISTPTKTIEIKEKK